MQVKKILMLFIFVTSLFAEECLVDDRIMYAIATIERHNSKPVGYPYLISLNSKKDQKKIAKIPLFKNLMLDRRTIDCESSQKCVILLSALRDLHVTNLDLGSYQLNFHYWKMKNNAFYFDARKSYYKACSIVKLHNSKEWTWENIAKYHSKTKKYNERYKKLLLSSIERSL